MRQSSKGKNTGKNSLKSTQQTIDMIECIENSVEKEKNEISSPSAVKPYFQQSPSPRINFDPDALKLKLDNFKDSPIFKGISKRKIQDNVKTTKKIRNTEIRIAYVEFIDPEINEMQRFKCYPDKIALKNQEIASRMAQNECDDDCATTKELKEISKDYLINNVSASILNVEIQRKTL